MRTFIIILNILLFSLILYNIIGNTNKIIENLEGCPRDEQNLVYACQMKLDRFFSEYDTVKAQLSPLHKLINTQKKAIHYNKRTAEGVTRKAQDELRAADKSLDQQDFKFD
ncbi:MAG: hypothetical protein CL678_05500 [Bdellovibrionaceae bacterium]|jgi:hypothetical protein|nr:hypothetical protein [Pseudobdellovibrionaceae bacterium]|tara:strand:+ start:2775 stop:3107 length:333 start_codon:yes stop_codon:yes gene_type:complete